MKNLEKPWEKHGVTKEQYEKHKLIYDRYPYLSFMVELPIEEWKVCYADGTVDYLIPRK